ncbi:hypothetical protein C482_05887 [Natrialba chahannaoensis JCM 10990]|uniref:Uncharacterized protein n=1 Tax=Natrialba chahannaoensis JCM 10990 TaxID=1227492 RepID=M0ATL6_9EURY|nr:hypothetical protein [Natrialba chahannaoensis]ELZ01895.1 hypothetical protein C482_05887 [Natrialba chahannaoensis JCM 10990]
MDRTDVFFALITFLLAALVYELGDGTTPGIIGIPVFLLLYGIPVYLGGVFLVTVLGTENSPTAQTAQTERETDSSEQDQDS